MSKPVSDSCNEAVTSASHRVAALNREWFKRALLPKAMWAARHEAFDIFRSHEMITRQNLNSGDARRQGGAAEEGREGKDENFKVECFRGFILLVMTSMRAIKETPIREVIGVVEEKFLHSLGKNSSLFEVEHFTLWGRILHSLRKNISLFREELFTLWGRTFHSLGKNSSLFEVEHFTLWGRTLHSLK